MPKKIDEWHQVGKPSTPSQINNFFDLCTKWLVGTPIVHKPQILSKTNEYNTTEKFSTQDFTFADSEVNNNVDKKCYFCGTQNNVSTITANPFTRKNIMFACTTCFNN
jgi:hypothetical protein